MGRAMLIICAGVLVALGYTFIGSANQSETMTQRNINTYYAHRAKNTAHSGIQIAIARYNNDPDKNDFNDVQETFDGANLTLSLKQDPTDIIRITSTSAYKGAEHTVISTYDISEKQILVPEFQGAISGVGSNKNIEFKEGNNKVHFDGHEKSGTCSDKPGFTVQDPSMVDKYDDLSEIDGSPPVTSNNTIQFEDIENLIEALADKATIVEDGDAFTENPGVFFINDYTHLSGKDVGYGILVVRNNAIVDIESELSVAGQFTFNGLVIFENGSNFQGTGKAEFNGTVLAASDGNSTFQIKANGNFSAQYDCTGKDYADEAVNKALATTIYKQLSVYE